MKECTGYLHFSNGMLDGGMSNGSCLLGCQMRIEKVSLHMLASRHTYGRPHLSICGTAWDTLIQLDVGTDNNILELGSATNMDMLQDPPKELES
jgi:hypothetical protein